MDVLIAHKDALCQHLLERYQSWFGVDFEFLLYDVQHLLKEKPQRQGQARLLTRQALRLQTGQHRSGRQKHIGYEVFEGNRPNTVEEMVRLMEEKYGQASRIWVMDRGMVSEENLDSLRERKAAYIVGTPKGQLRQFEGQLLDEHDWSQVQPGVEVKLVAHPDLQGKEQYVIARSVPKKNQPCLHSLKHTKLEQIDASLQAACQTRQSSAASVVGWGDTPEPSGSTKSPSEQPRLPSPQPAQRAPRKPWP